MLPRRLAETVERAEHEARQRAARFQWDPATGLATSATSAPPRDSRPLNVLMTKGGKSLFRSLEDDRVRVFWPEDALTEAPDIVVTTQSHHLAEDPRRLELPEEVWSRLRSGTAKLLFDSSSEGVPVAGARLWPLHDFLHAAGVAPSDCVYLTQDRGFRPDYLAERRARGLTGPGIEVLVYDRFIQYVCAAIRAPDDGSLFRRHLQAYANATAVREKRFLCLNNKLMYAHRTLFLLRLLRDGLWDSGHISLGSLYEADGKTLNRGQFLKRMRAEPELNGVADELLPLLDQLEARSPRYIGMGETPPSGSSPKALIIPRMFEQYSSSWFSIVIETDVSSRLHRITEKPFKPLLCFHPLIVMGSCGSLRLIREYGFKTFQGHVDESYDEQADLGARFEMVYRQVERLCRMDEAELARLNEAMADTVVFNACWGLTQLPRLFRDRIDSALIDRLSAFVRRDAKSPEPA